MSMNNTILLGLAVVLVLTLIFFLARELRHRPRTIRCNDGPRRTIDLRQFVTKYSAYSIQLEASLTHKSNKLKLVGQVKPVQLQQLSESLQGANEFRKYVVAGYNSCAITQAQYAEYGSRLHALDSLARTIAMFAEKPKLPPTEVEELTSLIQQYTQLAARLGDQAK